MAKKDELLFYLEDGTPVYAADAPVNSLKPRRFGDRPTPAAETSEPDAKTLKAMPFNDAPQPVQTSGNAKLAVDYSKDPHATSVPGQPGYDQSKDPFRKPEKKATPSLWETHANGMEARRLQRQLDSEKTWIEVLYPGARGRQHSPGGNNLGEPSFSRTGGHAVQANGTWTSDSGLDPYDPDDDIVLQEVLDGGNIYG